jgi:acetolactate synthase I/III small subunit
MRHTISLTVENKFGVLTRVAGLFSGRGYNIESLSVAETLDPEISKMTIVTSGDDKIIEQIIKQLNKLVNTIKVTDLTVTEHVEREMVLIKVSASGENRTEVLRLVDIFRGKIVDVSPDTFVIELTGDEEKIGAVLNLLKPLGVKDIVRTGKVAMQRAVQQKNNNK